MKGKAKLNSSFVEGLVLIIFVGFLPLLDNILESLLSNVPVNLPGSECVALGEHFLNLFQGPPGSLGEAEEDVNESSQVEGTEDEVGLPGNVG